jgi:hypothetical protein
MCRLIVGVIPPLRRQIEVARILWQMTMRHPSHCPRCLASWRLYVRNRYGLASRTISYRSRLPLRNGQATSPRTRAGCLVPRRLFRKGLRGTFLGGRPFTRRVYASSPTSSRAFFVTPHEKEDRSVDAPYERASRSRTASTSAACASTRSAAAGMSLIDAWGRRAGGVAQSLTRATISSSSGCIGGLPLASR